MKIDTLTYPQLSDLLIEQSPDAIVFADKAGSIALWNPAAERIFGFTQEQALGANLDIIIPERFRQSHWRGFDQALADASTKYQGKALPTAALRADGVQIYVELSFAIIVDSHRTVLGALAHGRDITERFEKERAARKRLLELEQALARSGE
jgi:PAS domain S-box-containing protein